jgi:hypothetical protein
MGPGIFLDNVDLARAMSKACSRMCVSGKGSSKRKKAGLSPGHG